MAGPLTRFPSFRGIFQPPNPEDMPPMQPEYNTAALGIPEDGPATRSYRDFLSTPAPERNEYRPTKLDRLGSILAGVSSGIRGGQSGFKAAHEFLDEPYRKALEDYSIKGGQLSRAAEQEEKSSNTRFRDTLAIGKYANDQRTAARLESESGARINNWNSQIKARDAEMTGKGWTPTTNKVTGMREYTRVNPQSGETEIKSTGLKTDETPNEKDNRIVNRERKLEPVRNQFRFDLFNKEENVRESNRRGREVRTETRELSKEERAKKEREARDKTNPNREFAAKALIYRDLISENPKIAREFDLDKMTHTPKVDALVKEELKKRGY